MKVNRLKTTYRRNMMLRQLAAFLIAVIAVILLVLFKDSYVVIDLERNKCIRCDITQKGDLSNHNIGQNRRTLKPMTRTLIPISFLKGYGFGYNYHYDSTLGEVYQNAPLNPFGNIEVNTECINMELPSEMQTDDWPIAESNILIPDYSIDFSNLFRQVPPPRENQPMIISFKKPNYPRGLRFQVDAIVKLGFFVKENGFIGEIDILSEQPEGFGFALAVKEALRDSWIKPAIVDGHKAGGYYILIYEFCEKCPDKPIVIESSSNVVVTIK